MDHILVSACILGHPVRFDGRANTVHHRLLSKWQSEGRIIPLCPEIAAGFPTPRAPAEIDPGKSALDVLADGASICEDNGKDVTDKFELGAQLALQTAQENSCRFALLTDGSPSCGSTFVFSGDFDGKTRNGEGIVTALLRRNGIAVFPETEIAALEVALDV